MECYEIFIRFEYIEWNGKPANCNLMGRAIQNMPIIMIMASEIFVLISVLIRTHWQYKLTKIPNNEKLQVEKQHYYHIYNIRLKSSSFMTQHGKRFCHKKNCSLKFFKHNFCLFCINFSHPRKWNWPRFFTFFFLLLHGSVSLVAVIPFGKEQKFFRSEWSTCVFSRFSVKLSRCVPF